MARLIMIVPMCGAKLSLNRGDQTEAFDGHEAVRLVDANFASPADDETAAELDALRAELAAAEAAELEALAAAATIDPEAAAAEAAAAEAAAAEAAAAKAAAKKKG